MKYFALLAFLTFLIAPSAQAQMPVNNADARAQILKGQIDGFLESQKLSAQRNGCTLTTKGQTTVEKASGYYALTLPHIAYTDAKGVRSEIGMVAVNATPDGEHTWKISVALPTPISSYGKTGGEQFRTDIGSQSASGMWDERLGHFTTMNANLGNVQFNDLINQSTVTIGALTLDTRLTERDPEAFTGQAKAMLNNISIFDAETSFRGTLPSASFVTNLADRASKTPMTMEQVKNRPANGQADAYNIFSFLFGAPERVMATVQGLDALNAQLQQAMLTAPPAQRQKYLQSIIGVTALSGMGQPVPGDNASKSYDVMLGQGGSVTVNGTDLGALMNGKKAAR